LNRQRRIFHGDEATIIEQSQNWYALDVDEYGNSSGDLREDAKKVLLALNMPDVEAFAIPSAGYLRKPGIRIRLFLWNSVKINCDALKKHFKPLGVVDTALFHPIQPIYIARPIFKSGVDPCNKQIAWISGENQNGEIKPIFETSKGKNPKYTKQQAQLLLRAKIRGMGDIKEGYRHEYLRDEVSFLAGKLCARGHFDEEEIKDEICEMAMMYWRGNAKNDRNVVEYAFKRAMTEIEGEDDA